MDEYDLLTRLTETAGPSGDESKIASVIQELWGPYADSFSTDRVGNLIALRKGKGKSPRHSVLLAAHMDEIGLMVTKLEKHGDYGFLRVSKIGGVDLRHLSGQMVVVHGRRELKGVIGSLPAAMLPEDRRQKTFTLEDLLVDVGLPFEGLKKLVSVGDFISFRQPLRRMLGKRVTGKALDNRASVLAVMICLDRLSHLNHSWDVKAVATSQEETRFLGAYSSARALSPDIALAIDVCHAKGPGVNDADSPELGHGPVLDVGPNVHPGIFEGLKAAAAALDMVVGTGVHVRSSGTDAFALQVAGEGIPTGVVSIPLRNMHTMVEVVEITDIERCGRLLAEYVAMLDEGLLERLAAGMMDPRT